MDPNIVHPTATDVPQSTMASPMSDISVAPYPTAQVAVAQSAPIGFMPQVAPVAAEASPAVSPMFQPAPQPLPVIESPKPASLPGADSLSTQLTDMGIPAATAPVKRSLKRAQNGLKIAAVFTGFMILTVGATFMFNQAQKPSTSGGNGVSRGVVVPEQDLDGSIIAEEADPSNLQVGSEALIVNGDVISTGALKMYSGDYFSNFVQGSVTADRTFTLPDASGVICLDSNNCGYATVDQIATLQGQFAALPTVNAPADNGGVVSINGLDGAITLSAGTGINVNGTTVTNTGVVSLIGSGNVVITDLGNGQFDISDLGVAGTGAVTLAPNAPQEDNTSNSSINITKTGSGNLLRLATGIPASSTARFVVDANGAITTGTIDYGRVTNAPAMVNSLAGVSGGITLGTGLSMSGQSLLNTGVTSLNGQTGGVSLSGGTGIGIVGTTVSNLGVTSISGTTNQVTVSATTGVVTLSLPQDIAVGSSPTFAALTVSGSVNANTVQTNGVTRITAGGVLQNVSHADANAFFTGGNLGVVRGGTGAANFISNGVLYGNGTGALQSTAAGQSGQCLVATTGGAPTWISCLTAADGSAPGGQAGGDLNGTYPNPTIGKLQGTTVSLSGLSGAQFLFFDGTSWINQGLTGDVTIASTGVVSLNDGSVTTDKIANGNVTNNKLQNSSVGVNAGTGLNGGGNVALGGNTTLSVAYGAVAGTAVQGNTSLTCSSGTGNLSGGGNTVTLGAGGACGNISISSSPTFATSVTTSQFILTGAGSNGSVVVSTLGQNTTYTLPDPGQGTATFCLSTGNCSFADAAGGDLTGNYPNPTIDKIQGVDLRVSSLNDAQMLVFNGTNAAWENVSIGGDVEIDGNGLATIQPNSVALGVDTTGGYVAALGTLTGLTTTGNSGEGSLPTLAVTYGSGANTAVQGNTTLSVTAGTNLTGGGSVTLGAGGSVTVNTVDNPVFSTSVTSPIFQGTGSMTMNTLATAGADDIIFSAAGVEAMRILENGDLRFEAGTYDITLNTAAITGSDKTITLPNESGTICTTGSICAGYAAASGSNFYVQLQTETPGNAQTGHFNIDGTGIVSVLDAGTIQTGGMTRITGAGILQNVSHEDAGNFFTAGMLGVARGGTGMNTFTQYGVIFGNNAGGLGVTAAGTTNQCLVGNTGSAPSFADCSVVSAGAEPGGTAGGDLGGTYPNPTVAKLQGTDLLINSPMAGHMLVFNTTNDRWDNIAISGDVAINETGVATIAANSVALGTDTTGNYISALGTVTGLTVTGNGGEGSTPTISVNYGATANTAVEGDTSITITAGTNLSGGGDITLGAGGSLTLNTVASPNFTSLSLTNALGIASGGTGATAFTANGILYGNGAGALGVTSVGTTGQCLVANTGSAPSWADCDAAAGGSAPGGGAGGDLTGTYPNPSIAKLQGTTIALSSLSGGQFLFYNGTSWINQGLTGDVAVASTGVATIQDNAITTAKIANGNVTNAKLQNSSVTVTAGLGLSGGSTVSLGGSVTLSVAYGAVAGTAVQGNTSLTCTTGTGNLSGGGNAITLGSGGTCGALTVSDAPSFATSVTTPQVILTGAGSNGIVQVSNLGQSTTFTLPDPGQSTATICLSTGNCASAGAAGGDLTGAYPNPTIAKLQNSTLTITSASATQLLVYNGTDSAWKNVSLSGDVSISEGGLATIAANSVALGTDTVGNYVANLGALTGLTTTGNSGESSAPTLSVTYGNSANTAVQGNTTLTCPSGTGNLSGGGTVITLGTGGTCGALNTVASPNFTDLTLTNALTVANGGTGASSLNAGGILFGNGTSPVTASAVLGNGQLLIGDGTGVPTVAALTQGTGVTISNGAGSITIGIDGTVCTTNAVCAGYSPASGSANYVNIQGVTPGSPQTGNFNITGTAIVGTLGATTIQTNGTTRITSAGVLQNVTNADASSFFTGGTLGVARGGTGAGTFTSNGLLYGNGTGAFGVTAVGTSGQCLVGNTGAAPSWSSCAALAEGSTPGGAAGGDLTGTYPNPTIGSLQGTNLQINTPVGGQMLIYNATNTRWENRAISTDVTISETGVATIAANSVALGTDTTGDYVANLGTLTGLSTTGNTGEGSSPTLSVLYGATANTAVQGNISLVCPAGTGNLTGGGTSITVGSGGSCAALATVNNPIFTTSVTSPIFQGNGSMTLNTLATAGADDIIFSTASSEIARFLENGQLVFGSAGSQDVNLYRAGANVLATDDHFAIVRSTTGDAALTAQVAGDGFFRMHVSASGTIGWSSGSGATDTNLYRAGADTLQTDDSFAIGSNLHVNSAGTAGKIYFGTGADTNLYRSAADTLRTDDSLYVLGLLGVGSGSNMGYINANGYFDSYRANAADTAILAGLTGESYKRFTVRADGLIAWGDGSGVADANLYRVAANTLKTDDNFNIQTTSNSASALLVQNSGGSVLFNADTAGSQVAVGVASGQKQITVSTSQLGTATTIATSSESTATAYSNQKKLLTLSTGRIVAVAKEGSSTGRLRYSDNGTTWTFLDEIQGWSNGSIASYVDTGGTERIVVIWKQSGTGGGRTDGYVYVMVGAFNGARTAITWGTAQAGFVGGGMDYPDVVAHAEGSGGYIHGAVSFSNGVNQQPDYWSAAVNSSGVLGSVTRSSAGFSTGGNANHAYPSIDIDTSTKRLFFSWSSGTTGAGKGIRFRTASYAGGAWTWASELEVDNARYVEGGGADSGMNVRWDGVRVVIGGYLRAAVGRDLVSYESTDFSTFVTRAHGTNLGDAGALYGFSMAIDRLTGDIYFFGSTYTAQYNDMGYRKWTRSTATIGSRVVTQAFTGTAWPASASALYANNAIHWIYNTGTSNPFSVRYHSLLVATSGYDTTSKLVVNGNIEASSITINGVALAALGGSGGGGGSSQWLQASTDIYYNTGKVGIGLAAPTAQLHVSGSTASTALLKVTDGTATALDVLTIADEGAATFRNRTNSTAAFNVQNAAGTSMLNVDTTTGQVSVGVAAGQKLISIPTPTLGSPVAVTTTTYGQPITYPSQKRFAALSTGRMVAVVNTSGTNAKFMYSDSGTTWADLGADIAGWSNGSITSYVDAGSTERLVVAWTQSGTGGGRTSGYSYAMTGAFNTARTAITWGGVSTVHSGTAEFNYVDLVAVAEGNGGVVHVISSQANSTPLNRTYVTRIDIDSTGATNWIGNQMLGGSYSVNLPTYPSMDIDPVTKRIFATWSAGAATSGKGIRFRTASYASGSWTWAAEVEVTNDSFSDMPWFAGQVRWDGTAVIIGGNYSGGSTNNRTKVWESTNFTNFTALVDLNENATAGSTTYSSGTNLTVDKNTRDVYLAGSQYRGISGPSGNVDRLVYRRYSRASASLESVVQIEAFSPVQALNANVTGLYANNKINWVYMSSAASPFNVKYAALSLATTGYDTTSKLVVNGNIEASSITINGITLGGSALANSWLQDAGNLYYGGGKVSIGAGSAPSAQLHVSGSTSGVALLRVTDGTSTGLDVFSIADEGAATFRNRTDSTAAFDVQTAAGGTILNVDSTNQRVTIGAASGQKEITVFTGEALTTPITITTSTSATATAFSNQKKLTTLSTGRMVTVIGDTSTNAEFRWSDDGTAWTDYASDIAGWVNGSITSYVDSGGTERLVATWKQSGTAGGRTNDATYIMVGSFNTARTTLTWGTPISPSFAAQYNYADVVVHPEGSGGQAHLVISYNAGAGNAGAYYWNISISASGVPTYNGQTNLSIGHGSHTFPSVDIDPASKRVFVGYTAGAAGSGKGLLFRTAAYSAGTWTWATEVQVSTSRYLVAGGDIGMNLRYDGNGRVLYGGNPVVNGTNYATFVAQLTGSYTSAELTHIVDLDHGTVASGSDTLFGPSLGVNTATGDFYILGSKYTGGGFVNGLSYRKYTRSTSSLGSVTLVDSVTANGTSNPHGVSAHPRNNGLAFVYNSGNASPYNVRYGSVAYNAPTTGYDTTSKLIVNGNLEASSITINGIALSTALASQWLQSANNIYYAQGSVAVGTGTPSARLHVSSGEVGTALLKVTDSTGAGADVMTIADGGAVTFKNQTNSVSAFQIQRADGSLLAVADTTTGQLSVGIASGQKIVGSPASITVGTPSNVGTTTTGNATAFSNQKKVTTLSTGRIVALYADTSTNAKVKWTDDGATWTDYGVDIAGWNNGSIYAYVDGGGTERLVAVWRQGGTGGSRGNGLAYAMVGTFNSARTTLTWGTHKTIGDEWTGAYLSTAADNYDVVAIAEGSNAQIHVVVGYTNGAAAQTYHSTALVTGTAIGAWTNALIGHHNGAVSTFPSIDINPTTKEIYSSWSSPTTGASDGIRFRKATYAGGAWTWGTAVAVDTARYVYGPSGGIDYSITGAYNAVTGKFIISSRTIDNPITSAWRGIYEVNVSTLAVTNIDVSAATPTNNSNNSSVAIDKVTGDFYILATNNTPVIYYQKFTESTRTLGSQINLATGPFPGPNGFEPFVSASSSVGRINFVYNTGSGSPYTVKYNSLALVAGTTRYDTTSKLVVNGNIEASSITINGVTLGSSNMTPWVQSGLNLFYSTGSVSVGTGLSEARLHVASSETGVALLKVTDATATARDVLLIADGGATTFRNQTDSTAAFAVQNAAGNTVFGVDSTNQRVSIGVASGGKTITIPSNILNTSSVVGTTSASTATFQANQKRLVSLSTGRRVAVYASAANNAKFKYTDNGSSWTDYSVDVAGWANGSITSYVDAGGIERLVAVWKQSGTGGGRVDATIYIMPGTFNADRSVLTWGTPYATPATASYDYPDIVAHAEGTGGYAHYTFGWNSGAAGYAGYIGHIAVSSSGVLGAHNMAHNGSNSFASSVHPYPSIAMNPVSKDVYLVWSRGALTGSGNGIRFARSTYVSANSWSALSTEVEVDASRAVTSGAHWVNVRWDGSRVVIGGLVNGGTVDLYQYESSNFTSFTTRALATSLSSGNRLHWGAMEVDATTGDVYYFGHNDSASDLAYQRWSRSTGQIGARTALESASNTYNVAAAPISGGIGWIYQTATTNVKYNSVSTLTTGYDTTSKLVVNGNIEASSITVNGIAIGGGGSNYWLQDSGNTFLNAGKVGIGTSAPLWQLHVKGTTDGDIAVDSNSVSDSAEYQLLQGGVQKWGMYTAPNGGGLRFWDYDSTNGTGDRLTIANNGSVGIGTSSPSAPLHVISNQYAASLIMIDNTVDSGSNRGSAISFRRLGVQNGVVGTRGSIEGSTATDLAFMSETGLGQYWYTNGAVPAKMVLTSGGNLGIGHANPTKRLTVVGANTDAGIVISTPSSNSIEGQDFTGLEFTYGGSEAAKIARIVGQTINGGGGNLYFQTPTGGVANPYSTKLSVARDGVIRFNSYGAGTLVTDNAGNITASSDENLKDVQGNFNRGLSDLLNIDPILYKWNGLSGMETGGTYAGFSAQNVKLAIPEAVDTDSRGFLTLQDRPLLAASVNAIKEMHASATQLDARVAALEGAIGVNPDFASLNVTGHTTLSSLTVSGNVNIQGKLTVANAEVTGSLTIAGRFYTKGTAPTAVLGTAVDQTSVVTVEGTDTAGTLTIQTQLGDTLAGGEVASITFSQPLELAPRVQLTPASADSMNVKFYIVRDETGFKLVIGEPLEAGKTYTFDYFVIGAQATN